MNSRLSLLSMSLAAWIASAEATSADESQGGLYELTTGSAYSEGCVPPCLCPVFLTEWLKGTFRLTPIGFDGLFWHYDVSDIDWTLPVDPPRPVNGSGKYKIGGDGVHQMTLALQVGDTPAELFDSSLVPGGSDFPEALNITVSDGMVCRGTVLTLSATRLEEGGFVRSDCNTDGVLDISDAVVVLLTLFHGAGPVPCPDACDANDDGTVNLADAIWLLSHLFLGTRPPPTPFPRCGDDPSADRLGCDAYAPCGGQS